jgi:hypothetical protein
LKECLKVVDTRRLLTFALHNGETVIGPIDDARKSILRKRLFTAGELMRSNQLAADIPVATPQ